MENNKGIWEQMREQEPIEYSKFTKKDLKELKVKLDLAIQNDIVFRKKRYKELEDNRKILVKKSKELKKEIPFELAYYAFLNFNKEPVSAEFFKKYKEWLD